MKRKEYSIHCLAHLSSSICLFGWKINEMTGIKTIIVWCVWIKCGKWLWHLHIKSHMSQKKNEFIVCFVFLFLSCQCQSVLGFTNLLSYFNDGWWFIYKVYDCTGVTIVRMQ